MSGMPNHGALAAQLPPIDAGRHMMAFNWLPAAYAHADWLGRWNEVLQPREATSLRVLQRISTALLDRYGLRHRHLRDVGAHDWLLASHDTVTRLARELGTAMLGGWVRTRLERMEVGQQTLVLGAEGRRSALQHALLLRALPFAPTNNSASTGSAPHSPAAWGQTVLDVHTAVRLGLSGMAALLDDRSTGARERFTLRFASGVISPLTLDGKRRDEAQQVIAAAQNDAATLEAATPEPPTRPLAQAQVPKQASR
ncbi:MAG: SctK family type III secretion system sorting platform protein [Rubrivivax sp.]|nr:SctK family type III secretion system sorting platform protein [Rubrivivax sp.]